MSSNHHTPPADGFSAIAANIRSFLSELDAAISSIFFTFSGNSGEYLDGDGNFSTPSGTGVGTEGHVIQDDGSDMTQRAKLNFTGNVTVSNAAGATEVEIEAGGIEKFTTLALIKAATGLDNDLVYCVETDTFYRYEATGSAHTANDEDVLITGDGGDTRWLGVAGQYVLLGGAASPALDNLASVQINADLIPDTDEDKDLGSSAKKWDEGHIRKIVADILGEAVSGDGITLQTYGRVDRCTGGTASASSVSGTNTADKACDDNIGTFWGNNDAMPSWWQYDFGSGNSETITKARVYGSDDWGNIAYCPKDFKIQGSNDGSGWTDLDTQTGIVWAVDGWKDFSFTNTTAYRYYRIYITANNDTSDWTLINEVELLADAELTNTVSVVDGKVGILDAAPDYILELLQGAGNAIADGYSTHSKEIYKTDIADAPEVLEKLLLVTPKAWVNKASKEHKFGLVADDAELLDLLPDLVSYNPTTGKPAGISLDHYIAFLHKGLLELEAQVAILKKDQIK